jgi:hypothetical protein
MMSTNSARRKAVIFLTVSVLLGFVGYIVSHPKMFGLGDMLCDWYRFGGECRCYEIYQPSVGRPLTVGVKYISVPFLILAVIPRTYDSWKRFGYWALPLIIILALLMPPTQGGFHYLPNRSEIALFLSKWYMVVSIIIMAYSWWQQRSKEKQDT